MFIYLKVILSLSSRQWPVLICPHFSSTLLIFFCYWSTLHCQDTALAIQVLYTSLSSLFSTRLIMIHEVVRVLCSMMHDFSAIT